MTKAVQITVAGRVQGVGFRWATKRIAEELGVTGYVINLINGHVKIFAQANQQILKRFLLVIKKSPTPYGHVSNVNVRPVKPSNYTFFKVK